MKKWLLSLYVFGACLLFSFNAMAEDFTISGKVSLIQEAVPVPFYEVNIADGEGKYVKTVKTGFNGKYSFTFDIPSDEKASFEVSVIDRCTGQSIIEAFEKEGNKVTTNFIICQETIDIGEEDDEKDEDEKDDDDGFGIPDFINCEALGLDIAVCVKNEETGELITYENACEAFDNGHKFDELTFCDGGSLPGDGIGGLPGNFDCDAIGVELPITVCVQDDNGEDLSLPLCEAIAEGYAINQIEFCEGFGENGLGNLDSLDCEGLGIDIPVCTTDEAGNEVTFDNPCDALAAGIPINQLTICDGFLGDGIGGLGDIDCDALGFELPFEVCVTDVGGNIQAIDLCEALGQGMSLDNLALCDGGGSIFESLNCDELPINIPVCTTSDDGTEITFETPCEALDAGIPLDKLSVCDGFLGEGLGGLPDFDCESLGLAVDIPICTTNELGEQVELMLCDALTQGVSLSNISLCDGALDGIDCSGLGVDLPVCTVDTAGNEVNFDNPCDALNAGIAINELSFCGDLLDNALEGIDCDAFDFDFPIDVCITNELGEQESIKLCEAFSQGYQINEIELCDNILDGITSENCDELGLNVPVCVVDADGNKMEFENPCAALDAGFSIEELSMCDNLLEEVMNSLFELTDTEEEDILVERADLYPNPVQQQLTLALTFVENMDYEVLIHSINGNAIYRQKFNAKNGDNVTDMDVSSLSAGIYVLKVVTPKGTEAMKFVKQ